MKAKTRFRLVILLSVMAAAGAAGGGFIVWRRHSNAVRDAQWRKDGLEAFAAGKWGTALELLGNYEPSHETDAEVLYAMARARLNEVEPNGRHLVMAASWFAKVVDLQPDNLEAKKTLLGVYVKIGMRPEAISLADTMLPGPIMDATIKGPDKHVKDKEGNWTYPLSKIGDIDALRAKGRALLGSRKYTKAENDSKPGAKETYERLLAIKADTGAPDPGLDLEAHKAILGIMRELKSTLPEDFTHYGADLMAKYPSNATAELVASVACYLAGQQDQGQKLALQAASRPITDHAVLNELISHMDSNQMMAQASQLLETRSKTLQTVEARLDWGKRLYYLNRFEDAGALLNDLNMADPHADADMMMLKAATLVRIGHKTEAKTVVDLMKNLTGNPRAATWGKALEAAMLDLDEHGPTDEHMQTILRAAQTDLADSPMAQALLGNAYAARNARDNAIDQWMRAAILASAWADPLVSASRLELEGQQFQQAYHFANEARLRLPDNREVMIAYALACVPSIRLNDKTQVDYMLQYIDKINKISPMEPQLLAPRMLLLTAARRPDDAIALVDAALAVTPPLPESIMLKIAEASAICNLGLEEKIFAACEKSGGLTAPLAFNRAVNMARQKHVDEGLEYLEKEVKKHPGNDLDWQTARANYLDRARKPAAHDAWAMLADNNPEKVVVQMAALNTWALAGDQAARDRILKRLEDKPAMKDWVKLYRATWLMDNDVAATPVVERIKSLQRADQLLKEYLATDANNIDAHVKRSACLQTLDALQHPGMPPQFQGAIEEIKRARSLNPNSFTLTLEQARLLIAQGEVSGVPDLVRPVLTARDKDNKPVATPEELRAAAQYMFNAGRADEALAVLVTLPDTDDSDHLMLLARLYAYKSDFKKAEPYVEKMLQHPSPVAVRFAADFYAGTNRMDKAIAALNTLNGLGLDPDVLHLTRADFFAGTGDMQSAQTEIIQAISANPRNSVARRQLIALRILQSDANGTEEAIRSAAKEVRDDPLLQAALDNIDVIKQLIPMAGLQTLIKSVVSNQAEGAGSIEALKIIAAAQNTFENRSVTAQKLRPIAEAHPRNLPLQMTMIQFFASSGRYKDAQAVVNQALQAFPLSAEPAQMATTIMSNLRQWDDVITCAAEWKKRAPQQAMLADQRIADACVQLRKSDAAIAALNPYLAQAKADPDRNAQTILLYARALQVGNRFDEARALMRPLNQRKLDWCVVTLTLIAEGVPAKNPAGQSNRELAAQWMAELDPLIPAKSPERAKFALALFNLSDRFNDRDFLQRSKDMLVDLAADPKTTSDILTTLGAAYEVLGDPAHAEEMYNRSLKANPRDLIAANNLAMIYVRDGRKLPEALDLIDMAIKDAPGMAGFRDTRALIQAKRNNMSEAIKEADRATRVEPENPEWWLTLLDLQVKAKDPKAKETAGELDARKASLTPAQQTRLTDLSGKI